MESSKSRRDFLFASTVVGATVLLNGCGRLNQGNPEKSAESEPNELGGEVTATEDLMREHGILRRALLVYSATAIKLRGNPSAIAPDALQKTTKLFKAFGEEYHEKKLEEAYIFPAVKKAGGEAARYADVLVVQHNRGR